MAGTLTAARAGASAGAGGAPGPGPGDARGAGDPRGAGDAREGASSAGRRRWGRRAKGEQAVGVAQTAAAIEIDVEASDPLLPFLATAPGPMDVAALPAYSPAVRRMKEQGVRLVVPLVTSGELVGMLALGPRLSERGYSRDDRRLLDTLARYAAPALRLGQLVRQQEAEARNLQRIEQELQVAQLIQQQFLPNELPELGGWHVAAFYRPARTVGGDFYDVIDLGDGRVMVVAGDVTDKGVPAALVMASTHALLRSTATTGRSAGQVLAHVNDLLYPQIPLHMFVTCLVLILDPATGRTQFANAGHNLPYVQRGGLVHQLKARGMPLGLMPGSTYEEHETVIEPGDVLFLYSDGITEQHDAAGEMFGFARTEALVAAATSGDDLVDRSVAGLTDFAGAVEQEDDITLLALHRGIGDGYRDLVAFEVPSVAGNERLVMDRVAAVLDGDLPPERLDALRTAVSETAMNAIEHGNREQEHLAVSVVVRRKPDAVTVDVTDFGRGRQGESEEPDLDLKLAGLQSPRGWGLFLVERLVDRVEESTDGERHTVRLVMGTGLGPGDGGTR
jgi:serine phosphatase RsbU (regulator of sigma subunit)/anti-sigma regulatory factor (Ser/Thr protein kinase)